MISNSHSHLVTCSAEPRKSSDDFWVPWRSQQCNRDVRQLTPTVGRVLPCCTYELTVGRRVASLQLTENLCHDDENSRQVFHCSDYQRVTDVTEILTSKGRFLTKSICLSIFGKILHTRNKRMTPQWRGLCRVPHVCSLVSVPFQCNAMAAKALAREIATAGNNYFNKGDK